MHETWNLYLLYLAGLLRKLLSKVYNVQMSLVLSNNCYHVSIAYFVVKVQRQ